MIKSKSSKKGSVLVYPFMLVLTMALFGYSLFTFSTSYAEVNVRFADVGSLDSVYVKEDLVNFYIGYSGERAVKNIAANEDSDIMRIRFNEEFKKIIGSYKFEESYLVDFQNRIKEGDFITFVEGNKIIFKMQFEFKEESDDLKFTYKRVIEKEFELVQKYS